MGEGGALQNHVFAMFSLQPMRRARTGAVDTWMLDAGVADDDDDDDDDGNGIEYSNI